MDHAMLLRQVPLLRELPDADLARVAAAAREQEVPGGSDVVEIGDPGRSLFVVLEGEVQVLHPAGIADFELARLGPGEFFGEMTLLNGKPGTATVRAATDARLLAVDRPRFREILLESPRAAVTLLEALSLRVRTADERSGPLGNGAMRDSLTGLPNRSAFHERLQEEVDRHRRYGEEFAILLLDVDHFEVVNDTFGHSVGDAVLGWLSRLFNEHTRGADVPFRLGGKEFAILAPATVSGGTATVATRLVRMVAEARPPVEFEMRVTVSCGHASCPDDSVQPSHLYNLADRALLQAKAEGRNRVCPPVATA